MPVKKIKLNEDKKEESSSSEEESSEESESEAEPMEVDESKWNNYFCLIRKNIFLTSKFASNMYQTIKKQQLFFATVKNRTNENKWFILNIN